MKNNRPLSNYNVYIITGNIKTIKTGGERYNYEIGNYLRKMGVNVIFINEDIIPKFIKRGIVELLFIPFKILPTVNPSILVLDSFLHKRFTLTVLLLRIFSNVKIFTITHHPTYIEKQGYISSKIDRIIESLLLKFVHANFTNSCNTKSIMMDMGVNAYKISIVSPAVDYPNRVFQEKELSSPPKLFYLGFLTPRKGLIYLLKALSELKDYDWQLFVGGDEKLNSEYVRDCKEITKNSSIEDRVEFLGHIDRPQINELFRKADIFILPSSHESYGMVIKEAASFGVPIITTRVGAIPEIVEHEESALLVPPKDPIAIKNAIVRLLEDEHLRKKIARGAFNSVDFSYNWETAGEKFFKYIKRYILINN